MKRKVIQIADSTQLISLPRKWALQHNIRKGDELDVAENGDRLSIYASSRQELKRKEIDISDLATILPRLLHALYKTGYDEVRLIYSNPESLEIIQRKLHDEIIGFEIVEQRQQYCVIRAFAEGIESEFDIVLRRIFLMLKSFFDGLLEAFQKRDMSILRTAQKLEISNNKYTSHCRRIINKGHFSQGNAMLMYCTVEELEKIADEGKYLCSSLIESPKLLDEISGECENLFRKLDKIFDDVYTVFYKYDIAKCVEIFNRRKALVKEIKELRQARPCSDADILLIHYFVVMLQKIINVADFKFQMEI
jgi:phosphate uptake regulator